MKVANPGLVNVGKIKQKSQMSVDLGNLGFMAPEVIAGDRHSKESDMFSMGVILFIMLAGFPPFQKAFEKDWWFDKLMKKKYKIFWMAHERVAKFSSEAKDIIQKLLSPDDLERIDVNSVPNYSACTYF